jgi:hypothetical protein
MSLDSVIRTISKKEELLPGEVLVILDAKTNEVLDRMPSMFSIRAINLYAVSNIQTANCPGVNYKLASGVLIEIPLFLGIPNGREKQAAQALQHARNTLRESNLESGLNTTVKQWVAEFVRENSEDKMLNLETDLQAYLKNQALVSLGLYLRAEVKFKHEGQLEPLPILSETPFPIHVKDFDDALLVNFEGELAVSDPIRAVSQWKKPDDLKSMVTVYIQDFCLKNLTLNEFSDGFKTGIRDQILKDLNKKFEIFGREFNFLNLKIASNIPLGSGPRIFQFDIPVTEKIQDFDENITVQNRVLIEVANIAKFRSSPESNDIEKWSKDVLQSAVKKRLMAATYKKLLLEQDAFVAEVRAIIRQEADKIGLNITEHIILPELKERRLVNEGFGVELQNRQFHTGGSEQMPISLNIYVKGRLNEQGLHELNQIYFGKKDKDNVFSAINTAVISKIKGGVIRLSTEQIFLKFEVPDEDSGKSPREILCDSVRDVLIREFKATPESIQINISHGQNEIISKARNLLGRTNMLTHTHKALAGNGADITYHFQYRIVGVRNDGWFHFFQNANDRTADAIVEELNKVLPQSIDSVLNSFQFEDKVAVGIDAEKFRREILSKSAFDKIGRLFGLEAILINHSRDVYQSEIEAEENFRERSRIVGQLDFESASKTLTEGYSELDDLKRKLRKEKSEEMPDKREIARLEREINILEDEIKKDKFSAIRDERSTFLSGGNISRFEKPQLGKGDDTES